MNTHFFDEANFYSVGSQEAQARVTAWHQAFHQEYYNLVVLLLTELDDPTHLATQIERGLSVEAAPLFRLLTQHERMMENYRKELEDYRKDHPYYDPDNPPYPSSAKEFFDYPRPPFTNERRTLDETLSVIEEQRQRCRHLLSARKADMEAGLTQKDIDPNEELDPLIRIHASRRREAIDMQKDFEKIRQMKLDHTRRVLDIRSGKA